jgi:hypothetical protein
MSQENQIWKRIEYERDKAFLLFSIYRDLGPTRSLEKVRVKYGESKVEKLTSQQIEKYSSKYNWVERASAYDDFLDEKRMEENWKAIEEMNKRQAEDAQTVQTKALEDLKDVFSDENSKASPEGRRNAAARTWEIGVKNERLARGAATEHVEQTGRIKQEHSVNKDSYIDEFNRITDKALGNLEKDEDVDPE